MLDFAGLSISENSEYYINMRHSFKSNDLKYALNYTLFDIFNKYDLSLGIQYDNKIYPEIFLSYKKDNTVFLGGIVKIENKSNFNIFLGVQFFNIFNKNNLQTNLNIKHDYYGNYKKISLRDMRKKNLNNLWKRGMNN